MPTMSNTNNIAPYSTQLALLNSCDATPYCDVRVIFVDTDYSIILATILWTLVLSSVFGGCFKDTRDSEIERLRAELDKAQAELDKAHTEYQILEDDLLQAEEELIEAEQDRLQAYELSCQLTRENMEYRLEKHKSTEPSSSESTSNSSHVSTRSAATPPALVSAVCALLKQKSSTARNLFVELLPTNPGLTKSDVNSCLYTLKARSITTFTQGAKKSPVWSLR